MKSLLVPVFVLILASASYALKCQTEDGGVTEDDVRRIVRVCMRKIGDNSYGDGSDYSENESDEYDQDEASSAERNEKKYSHSEDDYRQRTRDHYRGSGRSFRNGDYGDYNYDGHSRNEDRRGRNQTISVTEKQAERDRACIIHCFFQEMKMTNDRQLPDKHKVIQVITKDLRDKTLKEFYTNSIQECFYVLELDNVHRQGKCDFSNRLLQCLAERARTNCDDWDNRTLIF